LRWHDEKAHADIGTEGDAALLTEIFSLSRSLRWDAAKDLGRITGDTIAEHIMQTVQGTRHNCTMRRKPVESRAAEYCTGEYPLAGQTATSCRVHTAGRQAARRCGRGWNSA